MKVCLITATKNRHTQLERIVRFVLNQTSQNWTHLIYNNSPISQRLNKNLPEDKFVLVNNHIKLGTTENYKTLGEIYTDALKFVPEDCDVINFMDDDDIFFPDHVEEGLKGLEKGGKAAYKPKKSWYRYLNDLSLAENTLEPSIFVRKDWIQTYGFSPETTAQHLQWVKPLIQKNEIFVDEIGKPTYLCDWSQEIGTFKTSGDPHNPHNFQNYEQWSKDSGDRIITPCSNSWAEHYYKYIKNQHVR
jgi:hypothetical protein